ncbi:hypothetical protein IV102_08975 [bacterium]|nr:hypothetical protein [bacterium]
MDRRTFLSTLSLGALAVGLNGCGSQDVQRTLSGSGQDVTAPNFLLSATVAAALARSGALLLAAESQVEPHPAPLLGGAIRVDVDALTLLTEQANGLTDLSALQAFFQAVGVQDQKPVIVYDDGEMKFAARVRFLLGYCGAAPTWMVNGGSNALQPQLPAGGGIATPSGFQARPTNTPIALVFQSEVAAALKGTAKIVDVRTPAEFTGQFLLPGDARPGHIPGALNLPVESLFAQGLIASDQQLLATFSAAGLNLADRMIVYCHDGAKSSLAATLLVQAGFANVNLYYLSYRDWSQNPALPVEI